LVLPVNFEPALPLISPLILPQLMPLILLSKS
jgi:hypothetical protein